MAKAAIRLREAHLPGACEPIIAVGPDAGFGTAADERDRVDREAGRAAQLVAEASEAQTRMLLRLIALLPGSDVRIPFVASLERFLAALPEGADALSDDELLAAWRQADGATS